MRRVRPSFLRFGRSAAFVSLVAATAGASACAHDFDTTRREPAPLTLGDDLFQVLCDRVAATADPFDLEGRNSRGVCHPDQDGKYQDDYAEALRPMPAKVAVMVRHRAKMIAAFNAMFPDEKYGENGGLHQDLRDLMKALVPLYDDDTLPESTRTLAALFESIFFDAKAKPDESPIEKNAREAKIERAKAAREALARLGARKGYRPVATAIGVARPLLAYPKLAELTDDTIRLFGPGGPAEPELRKVLEVTQNELATAEIGAARAPIANYKDRFTGVAAQKPKLTSEILRNLLVDAPPLKGDLSGPAYPPTWADAFAGDGLGGTAKTVPFLLRDARGYAAFAALPAGGQDKDGDGLADVDALGRFVGKDGQPLAIASPFAFVTASGLEDTGERDADGRALVAKGGAPLYKYGDASKTLLHAILVDTKVLGDPANGALLDFAHAAKHQLGKRLDAEASYADPEQPGKTTLVKYTQFDADSPFTDLVYAVGRLTELPRINDYLELLRQLLRDHPAEAARVLGAGLKIREIASQAQYDGVDLDDASTLWDELAKITGELAAEPDVLRDVLEGVADPDILFLQKGMALFAGHKDVLDYNPAADSDASRISDPFVNVTTSTPKGDPKTKTDLSKPDAEDNRSLFQRFLSLMNDAYGVRACNKQGAQIKTKLGPIPVNLPLFGTYDECEVLNIPDLATFYLGCIAGGTDEVTKQPRCKLPVTDGLVSALNSIIGSGNVDNLLESSSGIKGLKQTPSIESLNRLVMWRNPNDFVNSLTEPMPTNVCPIASSKGTRKCASSADLIRNRQRGTIFMGEAFDALKGLRPLVLPFAKKRADGKERIRYFMGMIQALHRHWSPGGNATRCQDGGTPASNPKFCAKSDARAYEGILAEAFASDILPALHEATRVLKGMTVNGQPGTAVLAAMVRDMMDPGVAKALKLTDRKGSVSTTFNDGKTKVEQVTPYHLFADAINRFDVKWKGEGKADHAAWKKARSSLVDQFLAVEAPGGDVSKSRFKNPAARAAAPILIELLEDRIAEHKAKGDLTAWAQGGLAKSFAESVSGPTFAAVLDLNEKIYADDKARTSLGNLLVYLADTASANDALASVLTSVQDLLQVIGDEANMVPIYHALSVAAAPDGATKRSLDLIEKIGKVETDPAYGFSAAHGGRRVIPKILANAVTPMKDSPVTPIEVLIDVVSDLHRADPTVGDAFAPVDYGSVAKNVQEFLVDPTRGLEQFYAIIKNRNL